MKQIKFLLSLAVALLIVVPALAQDAWGVSGDAKAVFNYSYDDSAVSGADSTSSVSLDDLVINVNFNAAGEISPYIKMQYDKGDENRFWVGGTFKKGNFAGEANVKFDQDDQDVTSSYYDSNAATDAEMDSTITWLNADLDVAWVTYTMGAVEFKFDKGGIWGCDNTFKVTYTASDMMKVYVGVSQTDLNLDDAALTTLGTLNPDFSIEDDFTTTPLVNLGANLTAGMLKVNVDGSYAMVTVNDYKQSFDYGKLNGESFSFLEVHGDVTAEIAEGMSVKVYGGYGWNLDSFANDSGYDDDDDPGFNEAVQLNKTVDGFENTVSMKAGTEVKAAGATLAAEYVVISMEGDDSDDASMWASAAYDLPVGELTLTPGAKYKVTLGDEATELDVTLTAAVAF